MRIKQLSVFVGNETGRLVDMLRPLNRSGINILALSVSDSADFGIVRLLVSDTEGTTKALHDASFTIRVNKVLSYDMSNVPSELLKSVAEPLARAGINLEYLRLRPDRSGQGYRVTQGKRPGPGREDS